MGKVGDGFMTTRFRPLDNGDELLERVPEAKRFFDVWRGEPELARTFIRNLARKLDKAEARGNAVMSSIRN